MLWALAQPVACAGLLCAFFSAVLLRRCVQGVTERMVSGHFSAPLSVRGNTEAFGTLAAVVSGVGWGLRIGERQRLAIIFAGPLAVIAFSQAIFALDAALHLPTHSQLAFFHGIDALRGLPDASIGDQFLLAWGVGMLGCGILSLLPLPPLDGWAVLRSVTRRVEWEKSRVVYWLEHQNVGVAVLLAGLLLPAVGTAPLLVYLLDFILTPVLRFWMA